MNASYPFQKSPRCSATSKRTREQCKGPKQLIQPEGTEALGGHL